MTSKHTKFSYKTDSFKIISLLRSWLQSLQTLLGTAKQWARCCQSWEKAATHRHPWQFSPWVTWGISASASKVRSPTASSLPVLFDEATSFITACKALTQWFTEGTETCLPCGWKDISLTGQTVKARKTSLQALLCPCPSSHLLLTVTEPHTRPGWDAEGHPLEHPQGLGQAECPSQPRDTWQLQQTLVFWKALSSCDRRTSVNRPDASLW